MWEEIRDVDVDREDCRRLTLANPPNPVLLQARKQLIFSTPINQIVNALVNRRLDRPETFSDLANLRDFPCRVVGEPEFFEFAGLVELVDCWKEDFGRDGTVWPTNEAKMEGEAGNARQEKERQSTRSNSANSVLPFN